MSTRIILPLAALVLAAACSGSDSPSREIIATQEMRATRAADELMGALVGELTAAMKEGGPVHAVRYCADNAQDVTRRIGEKHGLTIRRVTTKARNEASVPDDVERQLLARIEAMHDDGSLRAGEAITELRTVDDRLYLQYMRPLTIKTKCLTCHGSDEDIPEDVAEVIAERYPGDRATGYEDGDVRGAISVLVPVEE